MIRPPRVLVVTPIVATKLYVWEELAAHLAAQQSELAWDWLIVDNTDRPPDGYVDWLRRWARSRPCGPEHKVRVKRFGLDATNHAFASVLYKVAWAEQLAWEAFTRWTSYDLLWSLECDVLAPPDALQTLYDSGRDWAASWMLTRTMENPTDREDRRKFPLLWHGLTLKAWAGAKSWNDIIPLGYMEPPTTEPFPCVVTHLGCTLIRGEVIRSVPFRMTNAGGDVTYSWACLEAGIQPWCIPAIRPEHVAEDERPAYSPDFKAAALAYL